MKSSLIRSGMSSSSPEHHAPRERGQRRVEARARRPAPRGAAARRPRPRGPPRRRAGSRTARACSIVWTPGAPQVGRVVEAPRAASRGRVERRPRLDARRRSRPRAARTPCRTRTWTSSCRQPALSAPAASSPSRATGATPNARALALHDVAAHGHVVPAPAAPAAERSIARGRADPATAPPGSSATTHATAPAACRGEPGVTQRGRRQRGRRDGQPDPSASQRSPSRERGRVPSVERMPRQSRAPSSSAVLTAYIRTLSFSASKRFGPIPLICLRSSTERTRRAPSASRGSSAPSPARRRRAGRAAPAWRC